MKFYGILKKFVVNLMKFRKKEKLMFWRKFGKVFFEFLKKKSGKFWEIFWKKFRKFWKIKKKFWEQLVLRNLEIDFSWIIRNSKKNIKMNCMRIVKAFKENHKKNFGRFSVNFGDITINFMEILEILYM